MTAAGQLHTACMPWLSDVPARTGPRAGPARQDGLRLVTAGRTGGSPMAEFLSADEAVARIPDGATLGMTGIVMCGVAEEVAVAIERAFRDRGHPRDLTLVHAAGIGNWQQGRGRPPRARGPGHQVDRRPHRRGPGDGPPHRGQPLPGLLHPPGSRGPALPGDRRPPPRRHHPRRHRHLRRPPPRWRPDEPGDDRRLCEGDRDRGTGVPPVPLVPHRRGGDPGHHRRRAGQRHPGRRGGHPGPAPDGPGGQEQRRHRDRPGEVHGPGRHPAPQACAGPRPAGRLRGGRLLSRSSIPRRPAASTRRCRGICGSPGRRPSRLPWVRAPWWSGVRPWSSSPVRSSTSASAIPTPWAGWPPTRGSTRW